MRMLIASDLHGSFDSLKFLIHKANVLKPDMLVLLGDLVYHGPRNPLPVEYNTNAMLETMPGINDLPCPVLAVRGNCDAEVDVSLMPFPMPENAWINTDGLRIYVAHGHRLPENAPVAGMPAGTVVLRGHTHIPRGETDGNIHFWNPGSLSLPKGGFDRTYGLYENGIFRVMSIKDREILRHQPDC